MRATGLGSPPTLPLRPRSAARAVSSFRFIMPEPPPASPEPSPDPRPDPSPLPMLESPLPLMPARPDPLMPLLSAKLRLTLLPVPLSASPMGAPLSLGPRSDRTGPAAGKLRLKHVDLIGLEHKLLAVTKLAKPAVPAVLLDLVLALAKGGSGLVERVEHFGHGIP